MEEPSAVPSVPICSARDEYEAAIIVAMLADHDILASTTGEFLAGFRAEAPSVVKVLVSESDADLARQLVQQRRAAAREEDEAEITASETDGQAAAPRQSSELASEPDTIEHAIAEATSPRTTAGTIMLWVLVILIAAGAFSWFVSE